MHSREQYLARVRDEYRNADKRTKTRLLNEARKRTRLNRKVLIGKLAHAAAIGKTKRRGPRQRSYTREVQTVLIQVWEMFDYPCGQRLAPALRKEVTRLRRTKELVCSDAVAAKLEAISPRSIDRLLERGQAIARLATKPESQCASAAVPEGAGEGSFGVGHHGDGQPPTGLCIPLRPLDGG